MLVTQTNEITQYMNYIEDTEDNKIEELEEKVESKSNEKVIYIVLGILVLIIICSGIYVAKRLKNKRED